MKSERFRERRKWSGLKLENKLTPVKGRRYITEGERRKCRRVAAVFNDMYEHEDLLVLDAGRYGFVKLHDYRKPFGFDEVDTFTSSHELFEDLWKEWIYSQLISLIENSPLEDLDYDEIYESLPPQILKRVNRKKYQLMRRAGLIQKRKEGVISCCFR